jgi:imidazole glycerol phosphate synthase subunit HisF
MDIRTPCQQKIRSINYITATDKRVHETSKHSKISESVSIPVIASSGAGKVEHFTEVFEKTKAEAALAAGIFHRKEIPI